MERAQPDKTAAAALAQGHIFADYVLYAQPAFELVEKHVEIHKTPPFPLYMQPQVNATRNPE